MALVVKNLPANARDMRDTSSLIPGSGRSPGGGRGSPLLTWRIPRTGEPRGHSPLGHKESDTTEAAYHAWYKN